MLSLCISIEVFSCELKEKRESFLSVTSIPSSSWFAYRKLGTRNSLKEYKKVNTDFVNVVVLDRIFSWELENLYVHLKITLQISWLKGWMCVCAAKYSFYFICNEQKRECTIAQEHLLYCEENMFTLFWNQQY